jgi:hypothetical protein
MKNIGFTGTRRGMTDRQKTALAVLMEEFDQYEGQPTLHHGAANGADSEAVILAAEWDWKTTAHLASPPGTAKLLLARNRNIVDSSNLLIAAPSTIEEVRRSGTWMTIRYARQTDKPVVVLDP